MSDKPNPLSSGEPTSAGASPAGRPRPAPRPDVVPGEQMNVPPPPPTAESRATEMPQPRPTTPETEYSSTIVAPSQIAVSVAIGVVLAVILVGIRTSLWPLAIVVFVALSAAGVYLAGVSVIATRTYLEIGQGRRERNPRYFSTDEIALASAEQLTWAQVFGIGLPRAVRTTRMTVRPGATLTVELHTGEVIRVSTPEPERAIAVLGKAGS